MGFASFTVTRRRSKYVFDFTARVSTPHARCRSRSVSLYNVLEAHTDVDHANVSNFDLPTALEQSATSSWQLRVSLGPNRLSPWSFIRTICTPIHMNRELFAFHSESRAVRLFWFFIATRSDVT